MDMRNELINDCIGRLAANISRAETHDFDMTTGSDAEFDYTQGCEITGDGQHLIVNTADGKRYLLTIVLEAQS